MEIDKPLSRVLIVDESRIARTMLVKQLRGQYDCREEADGEAAWQVLVLDHAIELVICSLSLPVLDGNGLLARVRSSRLPRLREMPMLMRYGDDEQALAQAKAMGASDWISRHAEAGEFCARVEALLRQARQHKALGEEFERNSPAAHARLATRHDVEAQAQAAVVQALHGGGEVSTLAMGFDDLENLRNEQGDEVVQQLQLRFATLILNKIRQEDGLGRYADGVFIVVTPGTSGALCELFADRLRESIHLASVVVHGRRLNLSVSVGVSTIPVDAVVSGNALIELAVARLQTAQQAGGNRVVSGHAASAGASSQPRIDHALALIEAGHAQEVEPHLVVCARRLLPLLRLMERELKLGLPLADIEKRLLDPVQEGNDAGQA